MYLHIHEVQEKHQSLAFASDAVFSYCRVTLLHISSSRWSIIYYKTTYKMRTPIIGMYSNGVSEEIFFLNFTQGVA